MKMRPHFKGILLFLFLVLVVAATSPTQITPKPSLIILMETPREFVKPEYLKLWKIASQAFEQTNQYKVIVPAHGEVFWKSAGMAASYSNKMNTDFMLYLTLSKEHDFYFYNAQLIKPKAWIPVATYKYRWKADSTMNEAAFLKLASLATHDSTGKITVNITIISNPPYSDVYRDEDRLGDTGENGFRKTCWWDKGSYRIKVSKPGFIDSIDTLSVEVNPTEYQKEVVLKKK